MSKIRRLFSRSTLRSSGDSSQPSIPISRESLLANSAPPLLPACRSSSSHNPSNSTSSQETPTPPSRDEIRTLLTTHIPTLTSTLTCHGGPAFLTFGLACATDLFLTLAPLDLSTPAAVALTLGYFWHYKLAPVLAALARARELLVDCAALPARLRATLEALGHVGYVRDRRGGWEREGAEMEGVIAWCRALSEPVRVLGAGEDWERVRGVFEGRQLGELQLLVGRMERLRIRIAAVVAVLNEG
ncbi:hypothetical protein B0T25DRAFT_633526 [Lasiosphaeria hispida]|uniref:Uncharacterized protein n=1 Tax=Lasiosphaeria hispida TaxID=260671 RepID=A0AAJ0HAN5_9PEZI|nr:hypothetical protein B0T25DRAFT_633526 [Lasiosphaeria hispida]